MTYAPVMGLIVSFFGFDTYFCLQAVTRSQQFSPMHRLWLYVLDAQLSCVNQLVEELG